MMIITQYLEFFMRTSNCTRWVWSCKLWNLQRKSYKVTKYCTMFYILFFSVLVVLPSALPISAKAGKLGVLSQKKYNLNVQGILLFSSSDPSPEWRAPGTLVPLSAMSATSPPSVSSSSSSTHRAKYKNTALDPSELRRRGEEEGVQGSDRER